MESGAIRDAAKFLFTVSYRAQPSAEESFAQESLDQLLPWEAFVGVTKHCVIRKTKAPETPRYHQEPAEFPLTHLFEDYRAALQEL